MGNVVKDIGAVSAYALAVEHGFKGTEAEWATLQMQAGENAQRAAAGADASEASAKRADEQAGSAAGSAQTAGDAAAAASTSQQNASASAGQASASARSAQESASSAATSAQSAADDAAHAETAAARAETAAVALENVAPAIVCSETGEVIAVSDAAERPLNGLRVFGKTTQAGEPTPDNPQELVNVGNAGNIGVQVCGKNLLTYPYKETTKTMHGINYIVNEDGTINVDGTSNGYATFILNENISLIGGMRYKLKSDTNNISHIIQYIDDTGKMEYASVVDWKNEYQLKQMYLQVNPNKTVSELVKPMLIVDVKEDVNYEAPKGIQLISIPTPNGLPGIPVSSGGNYTDENGQRWICDEIDLARGVYVQRVAGINDVAERDMFTRAHGNGQKYASFIMPDMAESAKNIMSNRYMAVSWANTDGNIYITDKSIVITDNRFIDVDTARTILAEENTKVIYILAAPIETPLDADTLAAYRALHTNKPNTTILNDAAAHMSVEYAADTKIYIDNKFSGLAAAILGNA